MSYVVNMLKRLRFVSKSAMSIAKYCAVYENPPRNFETNIRSVPIIYIYIYIYIYICIYV